MNVFHLLLYATLLAFLNVAYCARIHGKRHRVQNSEDVDAPVIVSATLNSDDAGDVANVNELPYCFSWEPCQFVFTKKNPKDNMPIRKTIPSWCRCDASQKCVLVEYDRRKKMDVHKCQDAEQPISISVRHLRSRGGGDQWILDMPVHRSNSRADEFNDSIE